MNRVVTLMLCWATLWMSGCQQSSEPTTSSVSIEGMHCDACAESIHETVVVIPGIESCEVSYENSSARMTADSPATIALHPLVLPSKVDRILWAQAAEAGTQKEVECFDLALGAVVDCRHGLDHRGGPEEGENAHFLAGSSVRCV